MFEKYPIPIPPLAEQERIVEILDKFDALVNDLSSGLPAEIAARRKQYEHYRDRLLTFRERGVGITQGIALRTQRIE
jgi:type I restriction enzyme S subunit